MTAPTTFDVLAAQDALARSDEGAGLSGDVALAYRYDQHCQAGAFIPPLLCPHGRGEDCNSCFLDHDDLMRRAEDI